MSGSEEDVRQLRYDNRQLRQTTAASIQENETLLEEIKQKEAANTDLENTITGLRRTLVDKDRTIGGLEDDLRNERENAGVGRVGVSGDRTVVDERVNELTLENDDLRQRLTKYSDRTIVDERVNELTREKQMLETEATKYGAQIKGLEEDLENERKKAEMEKVTTSGDRTIVDELVYELTRENQILEIEATRYEARIKGLVASILKFNQKYSDGDYSEGAVLPKYDYNAVDVDAVLEELDEILTDELSMNDGSVEGANAMFRIRTFMDDNLEDLINSDASYDDYVEVVLDILRRCLTRVVVDPDELDLLNSAVAKLRRALLEMNT